MRKIKFRAWDKPKKQMCNLSEIKFDEKGIIETDNDELGCYSAEIEDWEIMQFTGLKDKNGKEIYEGDIVKLASNQLGEVYFEDGRFNIKGKLIAELTELSKFCTEFYPIEVLGNKFENLELLK